MPNLNNLVNVALVIASCDAYSDAWHPFFRSFDKYWPDCPFQVYLIDETKPCGGAETISIPEKDWSKRMKIALGKIPHRYILYMQEDFILKGKVNTERILRYAAYIEKEQAACLRLNPSPRPNEGYKGSKEIGSLRPGSPYRLCLAAALWDKKVFMDLLVEGEGPWQAELIGSRRTDGLQAPFLSVKKKALNYLGNAIVKGQWSWEAVYFFRKERIIIDPSKRAIEPYRHYIKHRLRNIPILGGLFELYFRIVGGVWRRTVGLMIQWIEEAEAMEPF